MGALPDAELSPTERNRVRTQEDPRPFLYLFFLNMFFRSRCLRVRCARASLRDQTQAVLGEPYLHVRCGARWCKRRLQAVDP